jgi:hypothetical protein
LAGSATPRTTTSRRSGARGTGGFGDPLLFFEKQTVELLE